MDKSLTVPVSVEALELLTDDRQPGYTTKVWQANPLSVARYRLSETEQKLLLYAIAMIPWDATTFSRYRIQISAYAEACGVAPNSLYSELRDAAEGIATKPLIILGHRSKADGKKVDLITHWFSEVEFGSGYIDVTFPPSLSDYLLKVRADFFQYDLGIPLQFHGEYPIRFYQWCKRWKYLGQSVNPISVSELRAVLGLMEWDAKGQVVSERLPKYGDMKKWALLPALAELKRASDVLVKFREIKRPGTKAVESLEFSIFDNPDYIPSVSIFKPGTVKAKAPAPDPETAALMAELQGDFGLSAIQARRVVSKYSVAHIRGQAAIVRAKPSKNAAAYLLSALKDTWQPVKKIAPAAPAKKKAPEPAPLPVKEPEPPDPEALERFARDMARYKASKKGPKVIEQQTALNLGQPGEESTTDTQPHIQFVAGMGSK